MNGTSDLRPPVVRTSEDKLRHGSVHLLRLFAFASFSICYSQRGSATAPRRVPRINITALRSGQQTLLAALVVLCLSCSLNAQVHVLDTFDDGDPYDDGPVTWIDGGLWGASWGDRDAETNEFFGDWLWTPPDPDPDAEPGGGGGNFKYMTASLDADHLYEDASLQTQFRLIGPDAQKSWPVHICAREGSYCGGVFPATGEIILWSLAKVNADGETGIISRQSTDLDVSQEDINLKFDLLADSFSVTAWPEGDPEPMEPQILYHDVEFFGHSARDGIAALLLNPGPTKTQALFRSFEATPLAPPDYDGSDELDLADVNRLSLEIAAGLSGMVFDLDGDKQVNQDDLNVWVKDLKSTWIGDADLDGEFNSSDLVTIFQGGKFELDENALWQEGDWTADRRFDSSDLVAAFQDGGYEMGPLVAARAVPEPTTMLAGWLALIALAKTRRSGRSKRSCV